MLNIAMLYSGAMPKVLEGRIGMCQEVFCRTMHLQILTDGDRKESNLPVD